MHPTAPPTIRSNRTLPPISSPRHGRVVSLNISAPPPVLESKTCGICFGDITPTKTACGHHYHHHCLQQWIDTPGSNGACPECRRELTTVTDGVEMDLVRENAKEWYEKLKVRIHEIENQMRTVSSIDREIMSGAFDQYPSILASLRADYHQAVRGVKEILQKPYEQSLIRHAEPPRTLQELINSVQPLANG